MEVIFNLFKYVGYGLGGLFIFLFVMALLFGKRVIKKWEYEANFYNDEGREVGEFDIEMQKFAKDEDDFSLDAKFRLKHAELTSGSIVKVYLDDVLVMEGSVKKEGRIYLTNEHLKTDIDDPKAGQICRVMCSAVELFSEPIKVD